MNEERTVVRAVTGPVFTRSQIAWLMERQNELNKLIHPNWLTQNWDFQLALIDEVAEALSLVNWKWWKDTSDAYYLPPENREQFKLELIDMLHFVLSKFWMVNQVPEPASKEYLSHLQTDTIAYNLKVIACEYLATGIKWDSLQSLLHTLGMTGEDVVHIYAAKCCLNEFRQANGYKSGEYDKHWKVPGWFESLAAEDNMFLEVLMQRSKAATPETWEEYKTFMLSELGSIYKRRV
tara:strand:- start:1656 stop:2363 length:708 start_codon:yes stop_codon:yes gene_type:complete